LAKKRGSKGDSDAVSKLTSKDKNGGSPDTVKSSSKISGAPSRKSGIMGKMQKTLSFPGSELDLKK
jgi:hypothetical protein